jgi:D-sedoheptulose 7-phosphate isomerase
MERISQGNEVSMKHGVREAEVSVAVPEDLAAFVRSYRERCVAVLDQLPSEAVAMLIAILRGARTARRHIFVCGNGGSAATASHFAAGLGKDGSCGREQRFRISALTDSIPWITALANDTDYSQIFVEQLKNHAHPNDVLVVFSASGNSPNVLRAAEWANENGLVTVAITDRAASPLGRMSRHCVAVESGHIGHVEEAHFLIQHLVTYYFLEEE